MGCLPKFSDSVFYKHVSPSYELVTFFGVVAKRAKLDAL